MAWGCSVLMVTMLCRVASCKAELSQVSSAAQLMSSIGWPTQESLVSPRHRAEDQAVATEGPRPLTSHLEQSVFRLRNKTAMSQGSTGREKVPSGHRGSALTWAGAK